MGEGDIVFACLVWLNKEFGGFFWRNNSTGVYDKAAGGYRSPPPFCINGVSDIIGFKNGKTYFIEVKTKTGTQSEAQKLFEKQCLQHDIDYLLVRSVNELEGKINGTRLSDLEK